jgi:pimeloyl-ACP methyl ester carboxylesterase
LWRRLALALAVVTVSLATACTDEPAPPINPDAVAPELADTKPAAAPPPSERCAKGGNAPVAKMVITTADGVHLSGARFGAGAKGVLLLPQRGAEYCPWWDFAIELVSKGYHVLAYDVRGTGFSEDGQVNDYTADAAAGIAALKAAGAQRVIAIGASQGATTALITAGRLPNEVAGVVSLSFPGELDVTGGAGEGPKTAAEAAPLITAPVLFAWASGDGSAEDPQGLAAKLTSPGTQLVGRSGVSHGWDMLKIGDDDVRPDVFAFLQSYAG